MASLVYMSSLASSSSWEWKSFFEKQDDEKDPRTYDIEVTELISEVGYDLRGCLEANMASEASKMADIDNMHIHVRVIQVTDLNSEVRSDPRGFNYLSPARL